MLGLHDKPYGVLDTGGYYAPLIRFLDHARDEGFVRPAQRALLTVRDSPSELLTALLGERHPERSAVE